MRTYGSYSCVVEKPTSEIKVRDYIERLNEIEKSYKIMMVDHATAEIVYQTTSAYGLPLCFGNMLVFVATIDYFDRDIAIEI